MSAGYGRDVSCASSLRTGRLVTGWRLVAEALYRRITTPQGTLRGLDPACAQYGIDIAGWIGSIGFSTALHAVPAIVQAEMLKDERVAPDGVDVQCLITTASNGLQSLAITARVTLADESESFNMTVSVTEAQEVSELFAEAA